MTDLVGPCVRNSKQHRNFELNNNNSVHLLSAINESLLSLSSTSSMESLRDGNILSRRASAQELTTCDCDRNKIAEENRQRSFSDAGILLESPLEDEAFEVFPSLPDAKLESMGLKTTDAIDKLNDEEVEQKFETLSLSFSIDSTTIKDRCERQRRYRDQTEKNLIVEIEKFTKKVNSLNHLCVDMESTELLAALLDQIDIVMRASAHAARSAERFGAVQHEQRLSEAVQVMLQHVNGLKQQRDSARRQLLCTKRVLQDSNTNSTNSMKESKTFNNKLTVTKRRASIATIQQMQDVNRVEDRKLSRRTSELTFRSSSIPRNANRPNRLELGGELVKIKEGVFENELPSPITKEKDQIFSVNANNHTDDTLKLNCDTRTTDNGENSFFRYRLKFVLKRMRRKMKMLYISLWENSTKEEVYYSCALFCFCLSLVILADILVEFEIMKKGWLVFG